TTHRTSGRTSYGRRDLIRGPEVGRVRVAREELHEHPVGDDALVRGVLRVAARERDVALGRRRLGRLRNGVEHADARRVHELEVTELVLVPTGCRLDVDVVAQPQLVDVVQRSPV